VAVGVITGSGTYALPGFGDAAPEDAETPWGTVTVTRGRLSATEVLHVSRHGEGHVRLSNHVEHRANVWAMRALGARALIGCTACGAVDPGVALGSLVVFDDLHFLSNRLPDGSLCTFHDAPGHPERGHWILHGSPYSAAVRAAVVEAAAAAGHPARDGGCYGHVDGPRFNTPAEIASLAAAGVTAVSQTGGPETVLAGEAGLPYALVGYATDYANGVADPPTPVAELLALMERSAGVFAAVLSGAVPALAETGAEAAGTRYRFEQP
jgi:purine nucleoside phosphorylase